MKRIIKTLTILLTLAIWVPGLAVVVVSPKVVEAQDCFYPAHNFAPYSNDLTSATGWTKIATMANVTTSVSPPIREYGVRNSFSATLVGGQSNIFYASGSANRYHISGVPYRFSTYVKYGSGSVQWLRMGITGGGTFFCAYDFVNGVAGSCVGMFDSKISNVGDGWFKVENTFVGNLASFPTLRFYTALASDSAGTSANAAGGEVIYFTSPQVQLAIDDGSIEFKKYVPTIDFTAAWADPRHCENIPIAYDAKISSSTVKVPKIRFSNLFQSTESFDASYWAKAATTITANSINAPDGLLTADTLVEAASTASHNISRSSTDFAVVSGLSYRIGWHVKRKDRDFVQISTSSSGYGSNKYVNFDIQNGVLGSSSGATGLIEPLPDGWYKISIIVTATATTTPTYYFSIVPSSTATAAQSYLGDGSSGVYLSGAFVNSSTDSDVYVKNIEANSGGRILPSVCPEGYSTNYRDPNYCSLNTMPKNFLTSNSLDVTASNEIREDILTRQIEGNYAVGTFGYYIEEIKKFVANRMTRAGNGWTLYKDDKTTVYKSGSTTGAERSVP